MCVNFYFPLTCAQHTYEEVNEKLTLQNFIEAYITITDYGCNNWFQVLTHYLQVY
jgi:hypothetical protein